MKIVMGLKSKFLRDEAKELEKLKEDRKIRKNAKFTVERASEIEEEN